MNNADIAKKLTKLAQLDIDAVEAYNQALASIDNTKIHKVISQFRDDHIRHIDELSAAIQSLGEEPPKRTQDIKGFLIEGFTAIRSATGIEGALKAMRGNEKLTNSTYEDALSWELPANIKALIEKNRSDEKRHLEFIETAIDKQLWNESTTA